jgi:excisionase family DNA binding protein
MALAQDSLLCQREEAELFSQSTKVCLRYAHRLKLIELLWAGVPRRIRSGHLLPPIVEGGVPVVDDRLRLRFKCRPPARRQAGVHTCPSPTMTRGYFSTNVWHTQGVCSVAWVYLSLGLHRQCWMNDILATEQKNRCLTWLFPACEFMSICAIIVAYVWICGLFFVQVCMLVLDNYPDLLTVREVATILRVDRSYVYRLIREGRLPVLRPTPHKTRVVKSDLCAFLDAARPGAMSRVQGIIGPR